MLDTLLSLQDTFTRASIYYKQNCIYLDLVVFNQKLRPFTLRLYAQHNVLSCNCYTTTADSRLQPGSFTMYDQMRKNLLPCFDNMLSLLLNVSMVTINRAMLVY